MSSHPPIGSFSQFADAVKDVGPITETRTERVKMDLTVENIGPVTGRMESKIAWCNADGLRIDTDGRFENSVAPDERYLATHYGPAEAISFQVLEVELNPED